MRPIDSMRNMMRSLDNIWKLSNLLNLRNEEMICRWEFGSVCFVIFHRRFLVRFTAALVIHTIFVDQTSKLQFDNTRNVEKNVGNQEIQDNGGIEPLDKNIQEEIDLQSKVK